MPERYDFRKHDYRTLFSKKYMIRISACTSGNHKLIKQGALSVHSVHTVLFTTGHRTTEIQNHLLFTFGLLSFGYLFW